MSGAIVVRQARAASRFSLFGAGAPGAKKHTIEQVFVDSWLAGKRDALTRALSYREQRQLETCPGASRSHVQARQSMPMALRRSIWRMGDLPAAATGLGKISNVQERRMPASKQP